MSIETKALKRIYFFIGKRGERGGTEEKGGKEKDR